MVYEIVHENTKADNQSWRKKPRKFAPKSRLGCKTCKIRRVKCDLSRPSCVKCQSTGRTCDGYNGALLASKAELASIHHHTEKANNAESCDNYLPCSTISANHPRQWHVSCHGPISQNLGPFMIIPVTGSTQTEAMGFFEYFSIRNLNEYYSCKSWRKTLMYFSQTVPSVRYAAVALALIHRKYLDRDSSDSVHQPQSLQEWLPDKAPLLHYNRAIQLLLEQETADSTEATAITLLVCYLLTCFDHLACNYIQALKHLRGGVELSRNISKATLNDTNTYDDAKPLGLCTLIREVTRQIRRLDMQAVTFLVDWTPADFQEAHLFQLPQSDNGFQSLDQAADHLQILVAQVMRLRNAEQQMALEGRTLSPPHCSSTKDIVLGQLKLWSSLFDNMLQEGKFGETAFESYPLITMLRLQYTTIWIFLSSYGSGREIAYDNYLPQFQQCVSLAGDVAAAHERYAGSLKPSFTPEVGIIPVLYIIGAKCWHPVVRREVLGILRRQSIREAVWDSISAARVIEWIIEIEEGGSKNGVISQNMEQIAMRQRIEAITWVHVVDGPSAPRLDITYTFCAREGIHMDSLLI